jgi:hypothetical protein
MSTLLPGLDWPKVRRGLEWERHKNVCRASYELQVDGTPIGLRVCAVQHPTAIRPYYVQLPNGLILERKFSKLIDAQAAAIAAYEAYTFGSKPKHCRISGTSHCMFPRSCSC